MANPMASPTGRTRAREDGGDALSLGRTREDGEKPRVREDGG